MKSSLSRSAAWPPLRGREPRRGQRQDRPTLARRNGTSSWVASTVARCANLGALRPIQGLDLSPYKRVRPACRRCARGARGSRVACRWDPRPRLRRRRTPPRAHSQRVWQAWIASRWRLSPSLPSPDVGGRARPQIGQSWHSALVCLAIGDGGHWAHPAAQCCAGYALGVPRRSWGSGFGRGPYRRGPATRN
jgi:hypothetical protein